ERASFEPAPRRLLDQIVAFLRHEPRDDRDDGAIQIFRQTETAQQVAFAFKLAREIVRAEVRGDMWVGRGIPHVIVHAVRDANKSVAAHAQKPIETIALLRGLNLITVTPADGRERIAQHQTGLQSRRCALKQKSIMHLAISEAESRERRLVKRALIGEIVNGKERARARVVAIKTATRA